MKEFIDKTATVDGTDINRANLMALQGFQSCNTEILANGTIVETNADGHTLTTTFNPDGTITQVFEGDKTLTKTINIGEGSISEVLQ